MIGYYSDEVLLGSINQAYFKISKAKKSLLGFRFGKTDCWSLFCLYDSLLRNGDSKLHEKITNYSSNFTFEREFLKAGFLTAEDFFLSSKYEITNYKNKRLGDVAFATGTVYNSKTVFINTGRGWLNSGPDPTFDLVPYNMVSKIYAIGRPIMEDNNEDT